MAGLGRNMPGAAMVEDAAIDACERQDRRGRDKTVEQHGNAVPRARARRPRWPRVRGRPCWLPPSGDRRACRDEMPAPPRSPRVCAPVPRHRRRCRGRPSALASPPSSAAHSIAAVVVLAIPISPTASRSQCSGHAAVADIDRAQEFILVHRGCDGEIARRAIEFDRHHLQIGAGRIGDLVDRRAAARKIRHHLRSDFRRIGRDTARGDAVIAGEDGNGDMVEPRQIRGPASAPARSIILPGGRDCPAALSEPAGAAWPIRQLANRHQASRDKIC